MAGNGGQCIDPKTGQYNNGTSGRFNPSFPSSCPYVTSVGATQIPNGGSASSKEVACFTVIYSGGGFSNNFALPSYQQSAVSSYFANHKPPYTATQYNNTQKSRGYPDVAANGANYVVVVDGTAQLVYGTSASSPTFAAVVAIVNEYRAQAGKGPVGFLNPTFYANPGVFNDITSGNNPGCGTNGFSAVTGWDPVTGEFTAWPRVDRCLLTDAGLGTPNTSKLVSLYQSLQ